MSLSEYYSDRDNCLKELRMARDVWGCTKSTQQQWIGVNKALGFMVLYCPQDLSGMVHAHILELTYRASMLGILLYEQWGQ